MDDDKKEECPYCDGLCEQGTHKLVQCEICENGICEKWAMIKCESCDKKTCLAGSNLCSRACDTCQKTFCEDCIFYVDDTYHGKLDLSKHTGMNYCEECLSAACQE